MGRLASARRAPAQTATWKSSRGHPGRKVIARDPTEGRPPRKPSREDPNGGPPPPEISSHETFAPGSPRRALTFLRRKPGEPPVQRRSRCPRTLRGVDRESARMHPTPPRVFRGSLWASLGLLRAPPDHPRPPSDPAKTSLVEKNHRSTQRPRGPNRERGTRRAMTLRRDGDPGK